MGRLVVCALALTACIDSRLTLCGDGRACAPTEVCDQVHLTCVSPDQLAVCADSADATPCTAGPVTGACFDHVCLPPGCGNRVVEPALGEQCDDGNHISGDGCSADCTSNETCGNGIVDAYKGEACDEGDLVSHDGCDSRCQTETAAWQAIAIGVTHLRANQVAFDQARHRLVYVDSGLDWEWDGASWRITSMSAPNIYAFAIVYDRDHHRVVVFGEPLDGTPSEIVATWDGTTWQTLTTTGPALGSIQFAVYDARAHQVLAFTGNQAAYFDVPTATWSPAMTVPFNAYGGGFAYDEARDRTVVLVPSPLATWEWDGTIWRQFAASPTATSGWGLTYDPDLARVISVGGTTTTAIIGQVAAWNGATWPPTALAIPPRSDPVVWYDRASSTLGVLDGSDNSGALDQLLAVSSAGAIELLPPHPTIAGPLIYDAARERMLMLFGAATTWSWDGSWHDLGIPSPSFAVAAYDPIRGATVAYDGGTATTTLLGDTSTPLAVAPPPPAFYPGAMAYDYLNHQVVATTTTTWALGSDAAAWASVTNDALFPTNMAYDAGNRRVVGYGDTGALADLIDGHWVFTLSPGYNYQLMATPSRRSIITVPGNSPPGQPPRLIWERRGDVWSSLGPVPIYANIGGAVELPRGRAVFAAMAGQGNFLLVRQLTSSLPDETCVPGEDADGDGLAGCDDPDCWWKCHPLCPYQATCP